MNRKLTSALATAGMASAGWAIFASPAIAAQRTFVVTLLTGEQKTYTVDADPSVPAREVSLPVSRLRIRDVVEITVAPTATPTPSATPSATPTRTPSPTPSSTPTQSPSPLPEQATPSPIVPGPTITGTPTPGATPGLPATPYREGGKGRGKGDRPVRTQPGGPVTQDGTAQLDEGASGKAGKKDDKAASRKRREARERRERAQRRAERAARRAARAVPGGPDPSAPGFSLATPGAAPVGVPNFFIDKFRIPPFLLPIYQAAGIQYGVRWEVLAAINEIETDYGRNLNVSSAGAEGWMQFMPATWKMYGTDANRDGVKDPYNPVDAIFASARYLKAAGADKDIARAIFAYNHADWYVDSVLMRARLLGGLPSNFVGSLTGLTQGRFPVAARSTYADAVTKRSVKKAKEGTNAAVPVESDERRTSIDIFSKDKAPVIATADGKVVAVGRNAKLGRFVKLRDVYGNTYTYGDLGSVEELYPAAKPQRVSRKDIEQELALPKPDKAPTTPATKTDRKDAAPTRTLKSSSTPEAATTPAPTATPAPKTVAGKQTAKASKERLFANPLRANATENGGADQVLAGKAPKGSFETFRRSVAQVFGVDTKSKDVTLKRLRPGARVVAGTVLGRLAKGTDGKAAHVSFSIRPAGKKAPLIDPKPILDGWKLLETTEIYRAQGRNPFDGPDARAASIGQILLMSKEALTRQVLADPRVDIYAEGRRQIKLGLIDRRVLATLEFLSLSGLRPTVSSLARPGAITSSGNVSEHDSGNAVDIAAINGITITPGTQGPGSITDITVRRLLSLQGTMKPHQIITLMDYPDADNAFAMGDHDDHIHVGFHPLFGDDPSSRKALDSALKPDQWIKLVDRLNEIDNPDVAAEPSKAAVRDAKADRP